MRPKWIATLLPKRRSLRLVLVIGRPYHRRLGYPQPRERWQSEILVGEGYAGLSQKPYQFSCWSRNDSNFD